MSQSIIKCQELFCSEGKYLYPCIHHCRKMLCIIHLNKHEQHLKEYKKKHDELNEKLACYETIFDEDKKRKIVEHLQRELDEYEQLKIKAQKLVSMNESHASLEVPVAMEMLSQEIDEKIREQSRLVSITGTTDSITEKIALGSGYIIFEYAITNHPMENNGECDSPCTSDSCSIHNATGASPTEPDEPHITNNGKMEEDKVVRNEIVSAGNHTPKIDNNKEKDQTFNIRNGGCQPGPWGLDLYVISRLDKESVVPNIILPSDEAKERKKSFSEQQNTCQKPEVAISSDGMCPADQSSDNEPSPKSSESSCY